MPAPAALELEHVDKRFPGVVALDDVSLEVQAGEVHGLIGENGAGKTTLMRIAYGFYRPDSGRVRRDGREVSLTSPRQALAVGIGMVHQHSLLVGSMTVAENVLLGAAHGLARLPLGTVEEELSRVIAEYDLRLDPAARVGDLGVAARQRVEILRALHAGAQVLILDEPTAVLTPQEATALFADLRRYAGGGRTIVLITHKLPEVMAVTDRVTVLRRGKVVACARTADTDQAALAAAMVGRSVRLRDPRVGRGQHSAEPPVLEVSGLRVAGRDGHLAVRDVDLRVAAREIVGIAGVDGNGQAEFIECLAGLRPALAGRVSILGTDVTSFSPSRRRALGLRHVPEDRLDRGANPTATLAENMVLGRHRRQPIAGRVRLRVAEVRQLAARLVQEFGIATPSLRVQAGALSGGNLQKAIVAREFTADTRLLLAAQPTRGVDVGAMAFIRERLVELCEAGAAVVLVSAELSDLLDLCDRIAVFYTGTIAGVVPYEHATEESLGLLMAGVHDG